MLRCTVIALGALMFLLTGCSAPESYHMIHGSAVVEVESAQVATTQSGRGFTSYRVGPEDILAVWVQGHGQWGRSEDGSMGLVVDENGMIQLPELGDVQVGGLTVSQIGEKLNTLYWTLASETMDEVIPATRLYRLGAGDRLRITVAHRPDLSTPYQGVLVPSSGVIELPKVGELEVAGKSLAVIAWEVNKWYRDYVREHYPPLLPVQEGESLFARHVLWPGSQLQVTVIGGSAGPVEGKPYTVDAEGYVELPYIGKLKVAGLPIDEVSLMVNERLEQYWSGRSQENARPRLVSQFYRLAVGDELEITVPGRPDLSTEPDTGIKIAADGTLDLPLIGKVKVAGELLTDAQRQIAKGYRDYLSRRFPRVSATQPATFEFNPKARPYDSVVLQVAGHGDISGTYRIDDRGDIHLPLLKKIHVLGMDQSALEKTIAKAYSKWLNNPWMTVQLQPGSLGMNMSIRVLEANGKKIAPTMVLVAYAGGGVPTVRARVELLASPRPVPRQNIVRVQIMQYRSKPVYLIGEYARPGVYYMTRPSNVIEAISLAGGMTDQADIGGAKLIRNQKIYPVDLVALLVEGDMSQNVAMQGGDTIYIPDENQSSVVVLGGVRRPGRVPMEQSRLTLVEAVGKCGGLERPIPEIDEIRVIRSLSQTRGEFMVVNMRKIIEGKALPFKLRNGDVVYVPRAPIADWNDALAQILPTLQTISYTLQPFVQLKVMYDLVK